LNKGAEGDSRLLIEKQHFTGGFTMGTNLNQLQRYMSRGTCVALFAVLAIFLFAAATNVAAQPAQPIVVSQVTWGAAWPNGGASSAEDPAGGSWAVNSSGVVVASETYGGSVIQFTGAGFPATVVGAIANGGAVAIDSNNALFISDQYNSIMARIPVGATGTYSFSVDPTSSGASALPACTGVVATDNTAGECLISNPGAQVGYFGVSSMTFDKSNDLFFATDDQGSTPYTIYECPKACLYGTAAPSMVFQEAVASSPTTTGQYYIGGMSTDQWGNLYFTDSALANGSGKSISSNLWEATYVASSKSFSAPVALQTYAPASPGNYDDMIDSVYVDKSSGTPTSGNVYFALGNSGIYAMTNNKGVVNTGSLYAISNQGTKLVMEDPYGNLYIDGYTTAVNSGGSDTFASISLGGPLFPGSATTATIVVADNTEPCTPTLTLTFSNSQFAAVPTGSCSASSIKIGATTGVASFDSYTVTLTPTGGGVPPVAGLTVTDTTSSASSTTTAKGGNISSIDQNTWGPNLAAGGIFGGDSADSHSAAINSMGTVILGTSYGGGATGGVYEYTQAAGVITATQVGPFGGAGGMAIDSSNFLYVSSEYNSTVLKLPMNTNGTYPAFTTTTGLTACLGTSADAAGMCQISLGGSAFSSNAISISALIFDSKGDLFFDTNDEGTAGTGQYSIFECGPTCLYGATPTAPVLLFAEPVPSDTAGDQLYPGPVAVDSNGDVFFTDSLIDAGGSSYSHMSSLWEIAVDSSNANGYAATPTLLAQIAPACTAAPCKYNNELDGLVIDANNNIFVADQYTGIYELAPSGVGVYNNPPMAIAAPGAKSIVEDTITPGNFYYTGYNNGGDAIGYDTVGSATITGYATATAPTSGSVTVLDNFGCNLSPTLSYAFSDTTDTFAGTQAGTSDMALGGGCGVGSTITFTPAASTSGPVTTTMTVTDTQNGGSDTATINATAAAAQPVQLTGITSPVTLFAEPSYTLGVTGNTSGNAPTFAIDTTVGTQGIASITGNTLTITGTGTFDIDVTVAGGVVGSVTYAPFSGVIPITVNPATQTLTYSGATTATYSPATINLAAATTSSNTTADAQPITFALVSGPGTVTSAGVLTITPAVSLTAPIVVTADQAASTDGDYAAATEITISIQVSPAAQTITITTPAGTSASAPDAINVGATVVLAATSSSGGAVTFSIDPSSTAGAGSIGSDGVTLTALTPGSIVIDANQIGSDDYGAAMVQAFITVNPLGVVATPVITPASGNVLSTGTGGSDTVTITDATAGAAIWYTTDGSDPLTSETATQYTAPFTLAASGTVTAVAVEAGYTNSAESTATYTVTATPPAFTVSSSGGGSSSTPITITGSTPGTTTLTFTPAGGFDQTISFSCAASTGITVSCTFNPTTITPTGNDSTLTDTVTISKGSGSAALQHGSNPFLPGGVAFAALVLGLLGFKKRRGLFLAVVLIAGAIGVMQLTACGGTSSKTGTVTISSTGGGTTVTTTVNVVVK
jgi:hypothetical protein